MPNVTVINLYGATGASEYHAAQFSFERRYAKGLTQDARFAPFILVVRALADSLYLRVDWKWSMVRPRRISHVRPAMPFIASSGVVDGQ
jgi:hypothetical protein